MTARPIDAAEGYRLFLRHGGEVELNEVNEYLRGVGLRAVSPRMLLHYRRLQQHGFESYIPINRFDIAVAGDHAWSEELRARYPEVSRPLRAEAVWGAQRIPVVVESLGSASASVIGDASPLPGKSVVIRLLETGIARIGTVVRHDPESGRFHVAFDPYTSLPIAPPDSPFRASIVITLGSEAESVVAIADLMLKLDRLLARALAADDPLTRIHRLSLNSPLEIILLGGAALGTVVALIKQIIESRKAWYEGTKAKYETEGIRLNNAQKQRNAQLEADHALAEALDAEWTNQETPLLDELASASLPKGLPSSRERLRLIESARSVIELPVDISAELEGLADHGPGDSSSP